MREPRSFLFRCAGCGTELIHTVDLALLTQSWWDRLLGRPKSEPPGPPEACHCGGAWAPAGVPRLVNPEPGGDGMIFEVKPLEGWTIELDTGE